MFCGAAASKRRSSVACRGPTCGLRPECCASCWYICLPALATIGAAAGPAGKADGDGCTPTATAEGDATGDPAGFATGETVAGAAETAGAMAGAVVGGCADAAAGADVDVGLPDPWQAASRPVPPAASKAPAPLIRRRRLNCIKVPLWVFLLASVDVPRTT